MIDQRNGARRLLGRVTVVAALVLLPGCGGFEGIELQGKLFEAAGLTGALGGKKVEPKTKPRAPLVLPPSQDQLPEPGSLAAAPPPPPNQAWPVDPEQARADGDAALKRAQDEYCRNGNWKEKAIGDEAKARQGPMGTCGGSVFSVFNKSNEAK